MGYNKNITGIRGACALAVLLFHLTLYLNGIGISIEKVNIGFMTSLVSAATNSLQYGVEFFFAISGFLISATLLRHGNLQRFATQRVLRIYPVFIVLHLLFFILGPQLAHTGILSNVSQEQWWYLFATNLFLLPGVFHIPAVQVVAWTLSWEILFYCCAAFSFYLYRRYGVIDHRTQVRWLCICRPCRQGGWWSLRE